MLQNGGALKFDLSKVKKHFSRPKKKNERFMEEDCEIRIDDNIPSIFSDLKPETGSSFRLLISVKQLKQF